MTDMVTREAATTSALCRHHWVIETFAGWAVALASYFASEMVLKQWRQWRESLYE